MKKKKRIDVNWMLRFRGQFGFQTVCVKKQIDIHVPIMEKVTSFINEIVSFGNSHQSRISVGSMQLP